MEYDKVFDIEKYWQNKFFEDKIYNANLGKKYKFFLTVPYPYASGALHIGHGRTYVTADIALRFKKKQGYNTFWPIAYHVSGTPITAVCEALKEKDSKTIKLVKEYLENYKEENIDETLNRIENPKEFANYFASKFADDFKSLGLSIDFTREFTTMDEDYQRFIEWQFRKLKDANLIVKADYPVLFDIVDKNAVGEDDIKDGDTQKVTKQEFRMFSFELEDKSARKLGVSKLTLLASTLRPETIFGVTNLWIKDNKEYTLFETEGKEGAFISSKDAFEKLSFQKEGLKKIGKLNTNDLIGMSVKLLDMSVPILPGEFVDEDKGTGIVYSVPAHAPFDYLALEVAKKTKGIVGDIANKIKLISVVDIEGYSPFSAKDLCEKYNLTDLRNNEKIEEITKILYKEEFYNGKLGKSAKNYAGIKIKDIKDEIITDFTKKGILDIIYETSRVATTRAGHKVIVGTLKDQWFLDYTSKEMKKEVKNHINKMKITPEKYRHSMVATIDWLEMRPCARKRGLGTKLPFDKNWVIESLSDSTLYMAYYTIVDKIKNTSNVKLDDSVFDFAFYGKGDINEISKSSNISEENLQKMRDEFEYFYPVDLRHTAPPHITNHLSFYLIHHNAVFPNKMPKSQSFNEMLIREGHKMSKSKGNVISLVSITEKYGVDLYRLYVASNADLDKVVDWREDQVEGLKSKYLQFTNLIENSINENKIELGKLETLFLAKYYNNYKLAIYSFENMKFREAVVNGFFSVLNDIKEYEKLDGKNTFALVNKIAKSWLVLLEPIMPLITQELYSKLRFSGYLFNEKNKVEIIGEFKNTQITKEFDYISKLIDDIKHILELKRGERVSSLSIYTAEEWKCKLILEDLNEPMPKVIEKYHLDYRVEKTQIPKFYIKAKKMFPSGKYDGIKGEDKAINRWSSIISKEVGIQEIKINPKKDPLGKRLHAIPSKPSLYME